MFSSIIKNRLSGRYVASLMSPRFPLMLSPGIFRFRDQNMMNQKNGPHKKARPVYARFSTTCSLTCRRLPVFHPSSFKGSSFVIDFFFLDILFHTPARLGYAGFSNAESVSFCLARAMLRMGAAKILIYNNKHCFFKRLSGLNDPFGG